MAASFVFVAAKTPFLVKFTYQKYFQEVIAQQPVSVNMTYSQFEAEFLGLPISSQKGE